MTAEKTIVSLSSSLFIHHGDSSHAQCLLRSERGRHWQGHLKFINISVMALNEKKNMIIINRSDMHHVTYQMKIKPVHSQQVDQSALPKLLLLSF